MKNKDIYISLFFLPLMMSITLFVMYIYIIKYKSFAYLKRYINFYIYTIDKQMFFWYNLISKRTNVYRGGYMKNLKQMIKNILFILVLIFIFKAFMSYQLAKTEYKTYNYTVNANDTLWNIASNICSKNTDIYIIKVITDIKEINNMSESIIYEGQTIMLPIYN